MPGNDPIPCHDPQVCARGQIVASDCDACAQSCPVGAIRVKQRAITLQAGACNGCGICQTSCPVGALGALEVPAIDDTDVFLVCGQYNPADQGPRVPCIHAVGLRELAALYLDGARRVLCATGDCGSCENGQRPHLRNAVSRLNLLLASRDLDVVHLKTASAGEMAARRRRILSQGQVDSARRGFLGMLSTPATVLTEGEEEKTAALARLSVFAARREGTLFAHAPEIDAFACTGCNACVRICQTGVLTLVKDETGRCWYRVQAEHCTGCRLCVEICDEGAISLAEILPAPDPVELRQFSCRACGVEIREPVANAGRDGLCRICRHTGHHKKLFQVLT